MVPSQSLPVVNYSNGAMRHALFCRLVCMFTINSQQAKRKKNDDADDDDDDVRRAKSAAEQRIE